MSLRISRRLAGLLSLALAASCGAEEPAPPRQPPAPRAAPTPPVSAGPGVALFPHSRLPPADWDAENRRRVDPALDGWPLEAVHDQLLPVLREFVARVWGSAAADPAELLAEDFASASALRPRLEPQFDDGNLRVARAPAGERELAPVSDWVAACAELRAPFGATRPVSWTWVERLAAEGDGYVAELRLCAAAAVGEGAVQHNARWRVRLAAPAPGRVALLRSLELLSLEELVAERRALADHTARWIGEPPWLGRELRQGLGAYYFRQDRLTGNELLGLHGLAVGDVDGDGLDDVYLCQPAGFPNRLLLQRPDGTVRDASTTAKLALLDNTRSALIIDVDGDRHQDVVAALGPYVLVAYNDGNGVFGDQQLLGDPRLGTEEIYSLAAADPDSDGDLDIYCCRYVRGGMIGGVPLPYHDARNGAPNLFWRNEGQRRFREATVEVGLGQENNRYSLSALWHDIDLDGDVDLYVVNDFGRNNLYLNDRGRFRDDSAARGLEDMAAGMGVSAADFDLDGIEDLYLSNMYSAAGLRLTAQSGRFMDGEHRELHPLYRHHARGNTLLRGLGGGRFEDVTESIGGAAAGWSWGGTFIDLDNDGFEDLLVPNGFTSGSREEDVESFFWRRVIGQSPADERPDEGYSRAWTSLQLLIMESGASYNGWERNTAFRNLRGRALVDASACTGFDAVDDSRAVALADWDDDGRVDALVRSRTGPRLRFLRNQGQPAGHFASVRLVGRDCHPDAIGARVELRCGEVRHSKTLHAGDGFLSQSSKRLHFGLGAAERIDELWVRWPDGRSSRFEGLDVDRRYEIEQGASAPRVIEPRAVRTFASEALALEPSSEPVERFTLVEKLPMGPFDVPNFGGAPRTVADFAGSALLITLFSIRDATSLAQVESLMERASELERGGVRLAALSIDEGPDLAAARRWASERGFADRAGAADGELRKRLQVLYIEVLTDVSGLELPQSMLLDSAGQWVFGYTGPFAVETLLSDAEALRSVDVKARQTAKLMGGRWVLRSARDWSVLSEVFREIGAPELSALYAARLEPAPDDR